MTFPMTPENRTDTGFENLTDLWAAVRSGNADLAAKRISGSGASNNTQTPA